MSALTFPVAVQAHGVVYREGQEKWGHLRDRVNLKVVPLPMAEMLKHKVHINVQGIARWNRETGTSAGFYPKHITFLEGAHPADVTILKISRVEEEGTGGQVAFERLTKSQPTKRLPLDEDWKLVVNAFGTCTVVQEPTGNLF